MSSGHTNRGRNNRRSRHGPQQRTIQSQPAPRRIESATMAALAANTDSIRQENLADGKPASAAYDQPVAASDAQQTAEPAAGGGEAAEPTQSAARAESPAAPPRQSGQSNQNKRAPQLIPPTATPPAPAQPTPPSPAPPAERGATPGSIRAPFAPGQHHTQNAAPLARPNAPAANQRENGHISSSLQARSPDGASDGFDERDDRDQRGEQDDSAVPAVPPRSAPPSPVWPAWRAAAPDLGPQTYGGDNAASYSAFPARARHREHDEHGEYTQQSERSQHSDHPSIWDRQGHGEQEAQHDGHDGHEGHHGEPRDVRGDIGPLVDSLHALFERDRAVASQGGTARCGICYLHFRLSELHYREEEGFYVCSACARSLGHNRIMMVRRQQHS